MTTDDLRKGQIPHHAMGTPVMHAPARPVTEFGEELHTGAGHVRHHGVAQGNLAATQVGVDLALFIYDCPDADNRYHSGVVCNPVLTLPTGKDRRLEAAEEGCLSYPGAFESLARPDYAVVEGVDAYGNPVVVEGTGLLARCLQHETDHLKGMVFGDRLSKRGRRKLDEKHESLASLYPDDWPVTPKHDSAP